MPAILALLPGCGKKPVAATELPGSVAGAIASGLPPAGQPDNRALGFDWYLGNRLSSRGPLFRGHNSHLAALPSSSEELWTAVMSRGHCPDASGLRWPVPGSAIGFGRTDLAIGNGAGCGTPPVGSNAAVDIPVIVLFLAFLALRASNCNGWARSWGSGQGCERGRGRRCIRPGQRPQRPPHGPVEGHSIGSRPSTPLHSGLPRRFLRFRVRDAWPLLCKSPIFSQRFVR